MLSFGIEEEFVFLDAARLCPVDAAPECREELAGLGFGPSLVHEEFFQSQLEFASPVYTELSAAIGGLLEFRCALQAVAAKQEVVAAGVGTPYDFSGTPALSRGLRYEEVAGNVRALTVEHQINGLHIHVGVPDRAAGVWHSTRFGAGCLFFSHFPLTRRFGAVLILATQAGGRSTAAAGRLPGPRHSLRMTVIMTDVSGHCPG